MLLCKLPQDVAVTLISCANFLRRVIETHFRSGEVLVGCVRHPNLLLGCGSVPVELSPFAVRRAQPFRSEVDRQGKFRQRSLWVLAQLQKCETEFIVRRKGFHRRVRTVFLDFRLLLFADIQCFRIFLDECAREQRALSTGEI